MTRWKGLLVGAAAVVVVGVWLSIGMTSRRTETPARPPGGTLPSTQVVAGSLDDLLMELQVIPMEGQPAKPFALPALDGRRMALADLAGRPALVYFWATW